MKRPHISCLWRSRPPENLEFRLRALLRTFKGAEVFFRADDVGVPSANTERLLDLFQRHDTPLSPALTPTWVTHSRWRWLQERTAGAPHLFAWHQHGYRHVNHQPEGRKSEFGPARSEEAVRRDLARGKARLEAILDDAFVPVLTPPWNRLSDDAAMSLAELGFTGVSTYAKTRLPKDFPLPNMPVIADLHTRREDTPDKAWTGLLGEICAGLAGGRLGLMIHHQRMNDRAFAFLDTFLPLLAASGLPRLHVGHFTGHIANHSAKPAPSIPDTTFA